MNESWNGRDLAALVVVVAMVVWILYLFRGALERDEGFYEQRVTAHQRECIEAQQDARLAEVTR